MKFLFYRLAAAVFFAAAVLSCSRGSADVYVTSADKVHLFEKSEIRLGKGGVAEGNVIRITDQEYQTVDGFGAAMSWATCYNLLKMSKEDRTEFLTHIFSVEEGLGVGLVRVTIGASDFNYEEYTWCDTPGIENFRMDARDRDVVIPVLKEVYAINPEVKIIASPWSCPRWMKRRSVDDESDYYSWTSGSLRPSYYDDYAMYFVKWIKAMENEGFRIDLMTIQNEPLNHGNSMSMFMGWEEQRDFIKTSLGPVFEREGVDTKILVYDHNYNYDRLDDQDAYPLHIFEDADAANYVYGSAWHSYGGSVSELDRIVSAAPDKAIYFTEASIGTWNYDFGKCLINDFRDIFMGTLARGGKGVTLWNLVLDENGGPYSPQPGSCKTCYGAVTMMNSNNTIGDWLSHYYDIAHASVAIRADAVRVGISGYSVDGLYCQAFRNPDGSFGVIILNEAEVDRPLIIDTGNASMKLEVIAESIVSVVIPA